MRYAVLAQSKVTARALGAWLELCGERFDPEPDDNPHCHIVKGDVTINDAPTTFGRVADWIQGLLDEAPHVPLTVLVDSIQPTEMNPLRSGWSGLIAMLVLALPEARWVFGVIQNVKPTQGNGEWTHSHELASLLASPWRSPLFDPSGLRDYVRAQVKKGADNRRHPTPLRPRKAAIIDDENDYALFHGYTAYRFGYRAEMVTSWSLMEKLFGPSTIDSATEVTANGKSQSGHGYDLLLEDMNLNFPDGDAAKHLSHFDLNNENSERGRAYYCRKLNSSNQRLENSEFRIIITSGCFGADRDSLKKNRAYLEKHKAGKHEIVPKPTGGIFDLWKRARMPWRLIKGQNSVRRDGLAPGYEWPPAFLPESQAKSDSHSAPGRLLLVASHLIRRADALRTNANTPEECIRGALLATEALELLAYKTPTLSLQALELKHWFEAKAEVAFPGVGHHFEMRQRFNDIERETKASTQYMPRKRGQSATLDASVSILNRLVLIFREAGQFDEEEECMRKMRWLNRRLAFGSQRTFLAYIRNIVLGYAEWLVSSLRVFTCSVLVWVVLLSLCWWLAQGEGLPKALAGTLEAFVGSGVTTGEDMQPTNFALLAISSVAALMGFFHLGVFVSFLYSTVVRK